MALPHTTSLLRRQLMWGPDTVANSSSSSQGWHLHPQAVSSELRQQFDEEVAGLVGQLQSSSQEVRSNASSMGDVRKAELVLAEAEVVQGLLQWSEVGNADDKAGGAKGASAERVVQLQQQQSEQLVRALEGKLGRLREVHLRMACVGGLDYLALLVEQAAWQAALEKVKLWFQGAQQQSVGCGEGHSSQQEKPTSGRAATAARMEREARGDQAGEKGLQQWQQQQAGMLEAATGLMVRFEQLSGLVKGVLRALEAAGTKKDLSVADKEQLSAVLAYMGSTPQNPQAVRGNVLVEQPYQWLPHHVRDQAGRAVQLSFLEFTQHAGRWWHEQFMQLQESCRSNIQHTLLQLAPPPDTIIQAFVHRQAAAQHVLPFGYSHAGTFKPSPVPLLQDSTSAASSSMTAQPVPSSTLQVVVDLHLAMSKLLMESGRQQVSPDRTLGFERGADQCLLHVLQFLGLASHVPQALIRMGDVGAQVRRPKVLAALEICAKIIQKSSVRMPEGQLRALNQLLSLEHDTARMQGSALHSRLSMESLAKLQLLQGMLPSARLLDRRDADKQQQPQRAWGHALCSISATHSLGYLDGLSSSTADARAAGQVLDQGIAALDHGLWFIWQAVSEVHPALHALSKPGGQFSRLRDPFAHCVSPFTLLTLLERHCVMGLAITTDLDHLALPASLACTHMQLPASQAVLTAVLQAERSQAKRAMVQRLLSRAAKAVGALLQDLPMLRAALQLEAQGICTTKHASIQRTEQALATAFVTRALALLITLVLNQRRPLMGNMGDMARDLHTVMRALNFMGSSTLGRNLPWLPHWLQLMATNIALGKWDCEAGPGLGTNLMRVLQDTGDQLLFVCRRTSLRSNFMSWAQNKLLHVNVEWMSPATGLPFFSLSKPPSQQPQQHGHQVQETGGESQDQPEEEEQVAEEEVLKEAQGMLDSKAAAEAAVAAKERLEAFVLRRQLRRPLVRNGLEHWLEVTRLSAAGRLPAIEMQRRDVWRALVQRWGLHRVAQVRWVMAAGRAQHQAEASCHGQQPGRTATGAKAGVETHGALEDAAAYAEALLQDMCPLCVQVQALELQPLLKAAMHWLRESPHTLPSLVTVHQLPSCSVAGAGDEDELREELLVDVVELSEQLEALLPLTDVRADLHAACDTAALEQQLLEPLRAVLGRCAGQEGQPWAKRSDQDALLQCLLKWVQQGMGSC